MKSNEYFIEEIKKKENVEPRSKKKMKMDNKKEIEEKKNRLYGRMNEPILHLTIRTFNEMKSMRCG